MFFDAYAYEYLRMIVRGNTGERVWGEEVECEKRFGHWSQLR